MKAKIQQISQAIQLRLAIRRDIQEQRDKNRKLFMAGFSAFNNGRTCLAGNRENGSKVKVNVDKTYLFQ